MKKSTLFFALVLISCLCRSQLIYQWANSANLKYDVDGNVFSKYDDPETTIDKTKVSVTENKVDLLSKFVTCSGPPAQPSVISGNQGVCYNTPQTFSVVNDPLATSYIWTFPSGWTGNSTTNIATSTASNSGIISVVASNSCGVSLSQTINVNVSPAGFITSSMTSTNVSCNGGNNGQAYATVSGPGITPPLTYSWSNSQATNSIVGLSAGNYSVTIIDFYGCKIIQAVTINQAPALTLSASVASATCNSANGSATITPVGGIGPYTYTWSTGFNGPVLANVLSGTYSVSVQDAYGCTISSPVIIPNSSGISIAITSFTNPSCFGSSNGMATTTVNPGNPGPGFPTYLWSNGQNTGTATNLLNGVYTVTLTDAAGCIAFASVAITQPSSLTINVTGTNPKCFNAANGSASAIVTGGTSAYTYTWSPMPGSGGNTANPSGMAPGNYNVIVTDAMGCTITGSVALANPAQLLSSVTITNVSCFGACNAKAVASLTNAIGAISYSWMPISVTTPTVSGLCAGTYTMLATDQNSCTTSNVLNITQPPALTVSISAVGSVSCSGGGNGFATASASGGTPTYTYNWSNSQTSVTATNLVAGNYTITVTDSKSCLSSTTVTITQPLGMTATTTGTNITCFGQNNGITAVTYTGGTGPVNILWQPSLTTTTLVTGQYPFTHTVTLTDANGCSLTKTVSITQPPPLIVTTSSGITNCNQANGSASVTASGGTGGYIYLWSAGPTYTNSVMSNVMAGAYTVTVKDANNCVVSGIALINDIAGPTIAVTATTPASCYNGAPGGATVTAVGGMGTLTYMWSYLAQTTTSVNNLPAGSYTVSVTDQANCSASLTINITQPSSTMAASFIAFNGVSCNGGNNGSASILASGGNPGYTYMWTPSAQTASVLTNATAGNYTCTVTDINGCFVNNTINIFQPSALIMSVGSVTNIACNGQSNGAAQMNASGGTPGYTYLWSPSAQTNSVLIGVGSGIYTCSVTDVSGCVNTKTASITQPNPLLITTNTVIPNNCFGFATGQINTSITGGTPIYTIAWSPAQQANPVITNLVAGTYSLTVFDVNGCVTNSVYTLTDPPVLVISSSTTMISCGSSNSGSAAVNISGGSPPYAYTWNSPLTQTTSFATGLAPGNYVLTTTDAGGCTINASLSVAAATTPTINVVSNASLICVGQTATLTATGANTYTWNTTATGSNIAVSPASTTAYTVTATAANSCTNAATISQGVSLCTGINNFSSENDGINIYPNPFSAEIILRIDNVSEGTNLKIYNSLGQTVYKTKLAQTVSSIELNELPTGIYFAEITAPGQKRLIKLIKN